MKHGPRPQNPAKLLQGVHRLSRGVLDDLVTTLFPGDCRLCSDPLLRINALPVCEPCLATLRPQSQTHPGPLCTTCGEALGFESERFIAGRGPSAGRCTPCRRLPPAFTRAVAFALYADEVRDLISLSKFNGLRSAAEPLGRLLALAIGDLAPALDPAVTTLVTAVPLFRGKARVRGFNQAELLSAHALRHLRRSNPSLRLEADHRLLARIRATESQFGLNPRERRANLRDAFAVPDPARVAGRDVLLVDDIYTTGATARACASALQRAGARQIFVATVSRAQTEVVALWAPDSAGTHPTPNTLTDRTINHPSAARHREA